MASTGPSGSAVALNEEPGMGCPVAGSSSRRYRPGAAAPPWSTTPANSPPANTRPPSSAKALTDWEKPGRWSSAAVPQDGMAVDEYVLACPAGTWAGGGGAPEPGPGGGLPGAGVPGPAGP